MKRKFKRYWVQDILVGMKLLYIFSDQMNYSTSLSTLNPTKFLYTVHQDHFPEIFKKGIKLFDGGEKIDTTSPIQGTRILLGKSHSMFLENTKYIPYKHKEVGGAMKTVGKAISADSRKDQKVFSELY